MGKVIVYNQKNNVLAIIRPTDSALAEIGISAIAEKDVPAGVAYKIIESGDLPADRSLRNRWTLSATGAIDILTRSVDIPYSVSRFQARAALLLAGLLDEVEAMMAAPGTPALAKIAWQDAQEFRRTSPTVLSMAGALGMSDAQLDDLFTTAAGIDA